MNLSFIKICWFFAATNHIERSSTKGKQDGGGYKPGKNNHNGPSYTLKKKNWNGPNYLNIGSN
jgi:hypothetical protein